MAVNVSTGYARMILSGASDTFASIFQDGCMEIRTGPQPASADAAVTGDLIGRITRDGAAWVAGSPTGGLRFTAADRYMSKDPSHVWELIGLGTGNAGWVRLIGNAYDDGLDSLILPRIDGAVGTVGVGDIQLFLPSIGITPATEIEIESWAYGIPPLD